MTPKTKTKIFVSATPVSLLSTKRGFRRCLKLLEKIGDVVQNVGAAILNAHGIDDGRLQAIETSAFLGFCLVDLVVDYRGFVDLVRIFFQCPD